MAASVLALVPIVALYVFFQRYFVAGVAVRGGEGMTARRALRRAAADFYRQSWRLALLNAVLATTVLAVAAAAIAVPSRRCSWFWSARSPPASCTAPSRSWNGQLRLVDAVVGFRRCWRRGAALAAIVGAAALAGAVAVRAYADAGTWAWPLAALVLYLLAIFGVLQLWLGRLPSPSASAPSQASSSTRRRDGARPFASLGLAAVLSAVNVGGFVAAVLPLLTLTVAFSFLAAAHSRCRVQRRNEWRA